MRTLKKTLCLVLCLAMMAGLCAISASAFEDDAEITYKEAVAVLTGIGVINGVEDGTNFAPTQTLNRASACKIIAYMLGDGDIKATSNFEDCQGHWAESYIAYCAAEGIVNGKGDGTFGPDELLTGSAWGKMVLVALGYDAEENGMTGDDWEIGVAKLLKTTKLAANIKGFVPTEAIAREEACEIAFQGLQYSMTGATTYVTAGGVKCDSLMDAFILNGSTMTGITIEAAEDTLMAEVFPTLAETAVPDAFGNPARQWVYGTPIAVVYEEALAAKYSYVAKAANAVPAGTSSADWLTAVNNALGLKAPAALTAFGAVANGKDYSVGVNGLYQAIASQSIAAGDEVEVYVNNDGTVANIVITRYDLAQVTAVTELTAAQIAALGTADKGATKNITLAGLGDVYDVHFADFAYAEGDYVLVAKEGSKVLASKAAEIVEGKVTAKKGTTYTINGTAYTCVDTLTVGNEYKYVVNEAGVLEIKITGADTTSSDYAYIYAMAEVPESTTVNADGYPVTVPASYNVYAVLEDGSKVCYPAADKDAILTRAGAANMAAFNAGTGVVVCYSVNAQGKLEMATPAEHSKLAAPTYTNGTFGSTVAKMSSLYLDNETAFIFVNIDSTKKTVTPTVVTGYKNLAKTQTAPVIYVYDDTDMTVTSLFVLAAPSTDVVVTKPAYAVLVDAEPVLTADDTATYFTYTVSVNGAAAELVVKGAKNATADTTFAAIAEGAGFTYVETNGYVSSVSALSSASATVTAVIADYYVIGGSDKYLAANAEVYLVKTSAAGVTVEATTLQKNDTVTYVLDATGKIEFALVTRA